MRRLLTLLACLLVTSLAMADKVSEMEALKKAKAFMPGKRFELQKYASSSSEGGMAAEEPFYIFNVENGGGYVLVSANDQTTAILGYSTNGNIDLDNMPDNLRYWLDFYAAQLKAIDEGAPVAARAVADSKARTRSAHANIAPLITTTWNQDEPYNLMCPDGSGVDWNVSGYTANNRCVTGCVATAVAQVMYYHQWPQGQTTAIPSYTPSKLNVTLNALPATTFDWSSMKPSYSETETDDAAYAVAKLMRYVGQALKMNYDLAKNGGSGSSINEKVMMDSFGYSKNMRTRSRDHYTTTQWENMVYEELKSKRPLLYSGSSQTGAHQFVCDGYSDGLFHLNWGWGGSLDGYFVLSIADPKGKQGIGGGTGAYNSKQAAVFNFMPATENEEELPILVSDISACDPLGYTRGSTSEDFTISSLPGQYYFYYYYEPVSTYNVEVGWGLYEGEQLKKYFGSSTQELNSAGQYFYFNNNLTSASFGANLANGKYQLRQIFRKSGSSDEWTPMEKYGINYYVAEINGNALTISTADTKESFLVNSLTLSEEPAVGMDLDVIINITNTNEAVLENIRLWTAQKGSSNWMRVANQTAHIDPYESGNVNLKFQPTTSGTFTLKVTTGTSTEALATQDFTVAQVVKVSYNGMAISCIPTYGKAILTSGGTDNSKTSLTIPPSITVNDTECRVTTIADGAFNNWYMISSLDIPEGVEHIGEGAFSYCFKLKKLTLPSTLKSIGESAFYGESDLSEVISLIQVPFAISENTFTGFDFNTGNEIPSGATLFVPIGTKDAYIANGWTMFKAIEEGEIKETTVDGLKYSYSTGSKKATVIAGDNYKSITNLNVPEKVTIDNVEYAVKAIGDEAFYRCGNLSSVSLPVGLETIGNNAFWNCYRLKDLTLPEGLLSIGNGAFSDCYWLVKFVLPSSLKSIGNGAFANNSSLKEVISYIQVPFAINDNTFMDDEAPCPATLFVPIGTMNDYQAFTGWTKFKAIEEGEVKEATVDGLKYSYSTGSKKATVIAGDYGELTSIDIPAKVTIDNVEYTVKAIGDKAFYYCQNIRAITLPDGLETIGDRAFMGDYMMDAFAIPSHLKSIGDYAFYNLNGFNTIILPEGLKTIGESAFEACFGLEKLVLPSTLSSMGQYVISGCSSLTTVESHIAVPTQIDDQTFVTKTWNNDTQQYDISLPTATLHVPYGTKSKYEAITGWTMFQGGIQEITPGNGDANGDDQVTKTDAVDAISYLLGQTPDNFDAAAVDMNGDGLVTVTDIILLMIAYSLIP